MKLLIKNPIIVSEDSEAKICRFYVKKEELSSLPISQCIELFIDPKRACTRTMKKLLTEYAVGYGDIELYKVSSAEAVTMMTSFKNQELKRLAKAYKGIVDEVCKIKTGDFPKMCKTRYVDAVKLMG